MRSPLRAGVLAAMSLGLLLLCAAGAVFYGRLSRFLDSEDAVERSQEVMKTAQLLLTSVTDVETAQRAYVLSGDRRYLERQRARRRVVSPAFRSLSRLVAGDPSQQERLEALRPLIPVKLESLDELARLREEKGFPAALRAFQTGRSTLLMDQIRLVFRELLAAEEVTLASRQARSRDDARATIKTMALLILASLLMGAGCAAAIDRSLRRRERIESALRDSELRLSAALASAKEQAESLSGAYARLAAANKELESFSYSVSHDLRAPLRSIDGFSQAVLEDCAGTLSAESAGHLARVRGATQRMALLIDDMLELSRVSRVELRPSSVDLSALAGKVLEELAKAAPRREVEVSVAPGLRAEGDERLLRLALTNLLDNAWKFTAKTPGARVEFSSFLQPEGLPAFYVRDNGAGFDPAYAHKLFGAFQRLHAEGEFPGTGVGLATVQRVVHRHGGRVWAESAPGKGATFYFTIPNAPRRAE